MKIRNILVIGILLLVIIQFGFVLAQQEGEEGFADLTSEFVFEKGVEVPVLVKGGELNSQVSNRIEITGKGLPSGETASIKIGENEYFNIRAIRGYFQLDSSGKISEAEFIINEDGEYIFGNQKVELPADSTIIFKDGKIYLKIDKYAPELNKFPSLVDSKKTGYPVEISAENLKLPNGVILDKGVLGFEGEQIYAEKFVQLNGIEIYPKGRHDLFFDEKEHEGKYISFGEKKFIGQFINQGTSIKLEKGNPYIKIEGDEYSEYIDIVFNARDTEFRIENRESNNLIPLITFVTNLESRLRNDLSTGDLRFNINEEKISQSSSRLRGNSIPVEVNALHPSSRPGSLVYQTEILFINKDNKYSVVHPSDVGDERMKHNYKSKEDLPIRR